MKSKIMLLMVAVVMLIASEQAQSEIREYILGDIDDFTYNGHSSVDDVYVACHHSSLEEASLYRKIKRSIIDSSLMHIDSQTINTLTPIFLPFFKRALLDMRANGYSYIYFDPRDSTLKNVSSVNEVQEKNKTHYNIIHILYKISLLMSISLISKLLS